MLGVDNKVEYELLLSSKRCKSLCSSDSKPEDIDVLDKCGIEVISNFLEVAVTIYQADLYFLTIPLIVNAVRRACNTGKVLKISSEPPAATTGPARKRYGDSAIYEILESNTFLLRCLVELRTDQAACPLKSILVEAYHAMLYRKASNVMLVIAVSTQCLTVKTAQVRLNGESLELEKYVEFSLTSRRTLSVDQAEASEFVWQLSEWLIEYK